MTTRGGGVCGGRARHAARAMGRISRTVDVVDVSLRVARLIRGEGLATRMVGDGAAVRGVERVGVERLPHAEAPNDPPVRCANAGDTSANSTRRMIATKAAITMRLVSLMASIHAKRSALSRMRPVR